MPPRPNMTHGNDRRASYGALEAKHLTAGSEARDGDVIASKLRPTFARQEPANRLRGLAPTSAPADAVGHIAQHLRHTIRGVIVMEGLALGSLRSETIECEVQDCRARLAPKSDALILATEKRKRPDRPQRAKRDAVRSCIPIGTPS